MDQRSQNAVIPLLGQCLLMKWVKAEANVGRKDKVKEQRESPVLLQ